MRSTPRRMPPLDLQTLTDKVSRLEADARLRSEEAVAQRRKQDEILSTLTALQVIDATHCAPRSRDSDGLVCRGAARLHRDERALRRRGRLDRQGVRAADRVAPRRAQIHAGERSQIVDENGDSRAETDGRAQASVEGLQALLGGLKQVQDQQQATLHDAANDRHAVVLVTTQAGSRTTGANVLVLRHLCNLRRRRWVRCSAVWARSRSVVPSATVSTPTCAPTCQLFSRREPTPHLHLLSQPVRAARPLPRGMGSPVASITRIKGQSCLHVSPS